MSEGTVTINPTTGAASGSGAAKEVFDAMNAAQSYGSLAGPPLAAAKEQLANIARAVAKIIPHIVSNAVVSTTVATGIPVSTTGSAAAQTGATTATGSATGTVS